MQLEIINCDIYEVYCKTGLVKVVLGQDTEVRDNVGREYRLNCYECNEILFSVDGDEWKLTESNARMYFVDDGVKVKVKPRRLLEMPGNFKKLKKAAQEKIAEEEKLARHVNTVEVDKLMVEIVKMHRKHYDRARMNLIDRALDSKDRELFNRLVNY